METQQPKIVNFVYKAPVVLAILFTGMYGLILFIDVTNDSTTLINAAFAVMLGLSAICFSIAVAQKDKRISDRLLFAGERLLHGAILVIVTSLIKYLLFKVNYVIDIASANEFVKCIFWSVNIFACVVFLNGLFFAHTGIRILNDLLILRMTRHRDWDDMF
ncbi:hypothetical protein [Shewanella putrefaciens]|uniref:hypothetical protein n=1 Tax=Shewanella putrefaciens TaxID=24 RepID=UPI0028669FB1|nr:hypothetical protein [Shewanella putrefaciens]MDR6962119.1 hypothetical protein [Shewanella putrefaciens]